MDKKYILVGIKWIEEKKDYDKKYVICKYWHDVLIDIEDLKNKGYDIKLFEGEQIPLF